MGGIPNFTPAHWRIVTMSNANTNNSENAAEMSILDILKAAGLTLDQAKLQLRTVSKAATDERAAMFAERKESNKEAIIEIASDFREKLIAAFEDVLPGSHVTLTVRKDSKTNAIIATANDCHAAKVIESIHVDSDGTVCFGAEGAEQAKNVRARKKSA